MIDIEKIYAAPKATEKQIRTHYRQHGYEVRISRDGHVRFRPANRIKQDTGSWQEGRYIEDYIHTEGQTVLL